DQPTHPRNPTKQDSSTDRRVTPAGLNHLDKFRSGEGFAEYAHALKLCQPFPDSPEYAAALADLSKSYSRTDSRTTAQRYAEEAVQAAHRSGSHEALTRAYCARAFAYIFDERADDDSAESLRHARLQNDTRLLTAAQIVRANYLQQQGRLAETIELDAEGLREGLDAGLPNKAAFHAGVLARDLLMVGRFSEADEAVRQGLALARVQHSGAQIRLAAALLSVRRGDLDRAGLHLQRASELIPDLEDNPSLWAPPTLAEYLIATGRPDLALDMLARTMAVQIGDPNIVDEMLMWSARSAAELCRHARDRRDSNGITHARRLLDDVISLRLELQPPPFERLTPQNPIPAAFEALYIAETARCIADSPTSSTWEQAAQRCAACGLRWEEAIASLRWADALLTEGRSRTTIAVPLRSAYRLAVEMDALPLQQHVETLATIGKISLDEPQTSSSEGPEAFRSLTRREREVLAQLVAGRTYAEIGTALFISHKTVSVHVSNLLRKTGTSSGRELAALAARLEHL
ncbi:regulatory LuxR family protein, partial [Kribbella sp. VKM Ac-2500]|uniref:LuxR family transcriptional regulator n=1 Tax=Kribbella sp. VKM Ac-2500 TaxID=2512214 RepID=UPI0010E2BBFF